MSLVDHRHEAPFADGKRENHFDHRRHGHGQYETEKAAQLETGEHREDDDQRMKLHALAENERNENEIVQQPDHEEEKENADQRSGGIGTAYCGAAQGGAEMNDE